MARYARLGILVATLVAVVLIIVSQVRLYRPATRYLEIELENRESQVQLLEQVETRADDLFQGRDRAKRRLDQLTTMFPPALNTSAFIESATAWLEGSGAGPTAVSHTEKIGDLHCEATVFLSLPNDPVNVGKLFDQPLPWRRFVLRHSEPSEAGGTLLRLKLYAIDGLPPVTAIHPCRVPEIRVWLWPLAAKIRAKESRLKGLCALIGQDRKALDAYQTLVDLQRQIEYVEQVSAVAVQFD